MFLWISDFNQLICFTESHTPCSEVCDTTLMSLRDRIRKQHAVIAKLQTNNQELLREVIAMKDELILGGLIDLKHENRKK